MALTVALAALAMLTAAGAAAAAASPALSKVSPLVGEGLGEAEAALEVAPASLAADGAGGTARLRKSAAHGISLKRSTTMPYWACPESLCQAIVDPPPVRGKSGGWQMFAGGPQNEGSGERGGYDPQDLQSAYNIPTTGGSNQTVAIVDAYGFPEAEHDLAVYRERYGLSPCTTANGCFSKVNEKGEEGHYPGAEEGWETESALDIEMVSAACPECHIVLVEATSAAGTYLAEAVDTAARLGATEISNSWGSPEQVCGVKLCETEAADFDHPGVLITAAGGDNGYDNSTEGAHSPEWPASLPDVVAVGGTSLHKAADARGWSEEPWIEGGSGCSRFPKPEWQSDPACAGRMTDDVAADGACETPVSVYNIHEWANICGTSVSTPLVAGIEAHASEYARSLPGAEAFYEDPSALFDVTKGSNGSCTPPHEDAYFCHAEVGYDGPTGNGTPDGPLELSGTAPPAASTKPASGVSATAATLNGAVAPFGLATTYRFEYGPTTSYGTSVPAPEGSVGTTAQEVSQGITELEPNSVYHYRLVATSSAGTNYGSDAAFTTGAPSVTDVAPSTGPDAGGESVTITGTDFVGASAVKFGSTEAPSFTVESETSISAVAPPGGGPVDVTVSTPAGTSSTSAADRFSYDKHGSVLAWGYNQGLLGDGNTANVDAPVEVSELPEAVALSTGAGQSLALLKSGRVMAWGENQYGQVGDGSYKQQTVPTAVCAAGVSECPTGPYLEEVTAVSAGGLHSLALLANGTVVAWGGNLLGDLGSDTERSAVPTPVCTTREAPCKPEHYLREVVSIAAGSAYSLALLQNGTLMAWGDNAAGQLADGSTSGPETCDEGTIACSTIPAAIAGVSQVSAISAGWGSALALLHNGTVLAWGEGPLGELGDGAAKDTSVPKAVCATGLRKAPCAKDLSEVTAVAEGLANGFALLKNGTVVSWGMNYDGQLGDGTPKGPTTCTLEKEKFPCSPAPVAVEHLDEVSAIASGIVASDTLALLHSGELMTWGAGGSGQLGDGATNKSETPVGVCTPYAEGPCPSGPYLSGQVTAIAAGEADLVALAPAPGPVVYSVQPDNGPASGETPVRIIGGDLAGATTVDFGPSEARDVQVQGPDEITALTPPGSGTVDVTVTGPEGVSPTGPHFTYQGPPTVITGAASQTGRTTTTLNATVNPEAETVSDCHFEYGTSPAYGSSVPCTPLPGSGTSPVSVSAALAGLSPGAEYYFRAVSTNTEGTSDGAQQTFTTVSNRLPEFGRCVKLTGAASGKYTSASCTTTSAGEDTGKYEWQPVAHGQFDGSIGKTVLETRLEAKNEVECKTGDVSGEYTGVQTASISLTLKGCEEKAFNRELRTCQNVGSPPGEIESNVVEAELGVIEAGTKPSVGLALNPAAHSPLAAFECGRNPATVVGSVIAVVTSVDKMSTTFKLRFKSSAGVQVPQSFENEPEDTLSIEGFVGFGFEPLASGLTSSASLTSQEAVEIKAIA